MPGGALGLCRVAGSKGGRVSRLWGACLRSGVSSRLMGGGSDEYDMIRVIMQGRMFRFDRLGHSRLFLLRFRFIGAKGIITDRAPHHRLRVSGR